MLRRIHIRNHALITEVELNFNEGFHVFTGETGSGKSILLGALGLLLGKRADTASVGLSSDRAVVEGWFSAPHLEDWLLTQDLPVNPRLSIRREVLKNGRSRVFVNDAQASVAQLQALGEKLVDIHQQHDLGVSLEREALCHLLDQVGNHNSVVHTYQAAHRDWVDKATEWKKLDKLSKAPQGDVPYLKHQRTELEELNLDALDWPELEAAMRTLSRASELTSGLEGAARALDRDDSGALGQLDRVLKALRRVAGVDAEIDEALVRTESARIELQDLAETLDDLGRQKQPDPAKLRMLEEHHDALWSATKKHNVASPENLLARQHELDAQIQSLEGLADDLHEAQAKMNKAHSAMQAAGHDLREARLAAGATVVGRVLPLLGDLKMPHSCMDWESEDVPADALGLDSPVIQFSSNPGSPLQPLTKVASGGERARFALALKSVLAQVQSTPVVVLDEIDTGVSGEVASFMGAAMRAIAHSDQTAQVLSVTHLPQVAAQAEHHWEVRKATDGMTTEVGVTALDEEGKLKAIATMLSASEVTAEALGQASQLLAAAKAH